MNYKELFNRVVMLISSPAKAWEEIVGEEDKKKVMGAFVYPMIGKQDFKCRRSVDLPQPEGPQRITNSPC